MTTSLPVFGLQFAGPNITIGSYRATTGREGRGYAATLLLDGVKVASFADWGDGGPPRITWSNKNQSHLLNDVAAGFTPGAGSYPKDLCESLTTDGYAGAVDEWILNELSVHEELVRKFDRASVKKTIFLNGDANPAISHQELNSPLSPVMEAWLVDQPGMRNVRVWVKGTGWKAL